MRKYLLILASSLGLITNSFAKNEWPDPLFRPVPESVSKVFFNNQIIESETINYFSQDNLYNGAGVGIGDINNDGLADLYFVSNQGEDRIYLNKGELKFKDVSKKALGNQSIDGWKTGVTMVDINADGWLDIYVTKYGLADTPYEKRRNLLYINQGNGTFKEEGKTYGVDDAGHGIHASFFDFDQDGDLDLFIVNHRKNTSILEQFNKTMKLEAAYSNRLLRNDNGKFTDITSMANGTETYGYCLSASISDINNDGWPDVYITSDYNLPDFLLINMRDGTFRNEIKQRVMHTSNYSMGIDIADFNNDNQMDVCVLDMSNKDYKKSKTNMGGMSIDAFWNNVAKGYHYQYMYNTLFLNLGSGYYSEIAQMAGVSSTDWSWAPLLADFDRDGLKDLFVTNGYYRDVRDRDFTIALKAYLDSQPETFDFEKMTKLIPQSREVNYVFRNKGDLTFENVSKNWGIDFGSVSQGAAYGDLDNDGDLDLVINNMNEIATILENTTTEGQYLNVKLRGSEKNPGAIGAKVVLRTDNGIFVQELYPSRGYASSCDYTLNFGLDVIRNVNQIEVFWSHSEVTRLDNIETGQTILIEYEKSKKEPSGLFSQTYAQDNTLFLVSEDKYDDFERELLIPHKMSELGPFMSKGDVNGDGLEDLYVGGGKNSPGRIYLMTETGLKMSPQSISTDDRIYEDGESVFFDADNDGDLDLYVVSGGNEYPALDTMYRDRIYINDGKGVLNRDNSRLPTINSSGQCVKPHDFDNDGDIDLFVGGRQVPGKYPSAPESYWLINEDGKFQNHIDSIAPGLKFSGMITDVEFTDLNADGSDDLLILGEWMPLAVYIRNGDQYIKPEKRIISADEYGINGWWNCVQPIDIDNDGTSEFLVGNTGLNNKFHVNPHHELRVYLNDFDDNGQLDIVLSKQVNGVELPVRGKQCLSEQMPVISEQFVKYTDFANASFNDIFEVPEDYLFADNFMNGILIQNKGCLEFHPFTNMGQIGPINEFIPLNLNGDEFIDFVAIGNRYEAEIETPRYDGNPGLAFINDGGTGKFRIYPLEVNGNFANRNAKDAVVIGDMLLISNAMKSINVANISWF